MKAVAKSGMILLALVFLVATASPAQQPGGMHRGKTTPGPSDNMMRSDNMMMMSNMMQHMQHMMAGGKMSPEHQKQMSEIMGKMGNIMNEMHGQNTMKLHTQHHKQLEDLDRQLKSIPE